MKNVILLFALGLVFIGCKKENPEPTAQPAPVATSNYTIQFFAGDYGPTHYTDVVIRVNGDSIGVLTSHTTTLNAEGVSNFYDANGEFPPGALSFDVDLNSSYNIEAYTLSGQLIGSTGMKQLILVPDNDFGGNKPWLTDDVWNGNASSPVGTNGNDCSFVGINKTLLLIFELED